MDRFILVLGRRAAVGTNVNIPIYCPTLEYYIWPTCPNDVADAFELRH